MRERQLQLQEIEREKPSEEGREVKEMKRRRLKMRIQEKIQSIVL